MDIDFAKALRDAKAAGRFDESAVEVIGYEDDKPCVFDKTQAGDARSLLPHRIESYFGTERKTLHFVVPDERCRRRPKDRQS